jgi:putative ABC transport system permease protein
MMLTVGSAALVVLLVLASAGFVRGMQRSLQSTGETNNVMLVGAGSEESVERSEIVRGVETHLLASVKGLKTTLGQAHVSPEVHMQVGLKTSPKEAARPGSLRGFTAAAFLVHPKVRVVQGRVPRAGADEIMAGALAATRMGLPEGRLGVGQVMYVDQRPWKVIGVFEAGGTVMDSEIWVPLNDLLIAAKRTTLSCVVATLDTAELTDVDLFAKQRLDLEIVAIGEKAYYDGLSAFFRPIQAVALVTASLMALSGLFGGLNTMYAAFAARVREYGALQTLGFPRRSIVLSAVQESVLASCIGALIASAIGAAALDGVAVRFSLGAFGLIVDSSVLLVGLVAGLILGAVGALPPAWRCLRLPIPTALKAV